MDFGIIESSRIRQRYTVKALCQLAEIDYSTYYKIKANPNSANFSTIKKIVDVLKLSASETKQLFS